MRRVFLAVGLLATVSLAKILGIPDFKKTSSAVPERKRHREADLSISLDEANMMEMVEDFKDFGVEYWRETRPQREEVLKALKEAYKNTASKLLMNFGRVFSPILHEWADIMKYVQVNKECDQDCAVDCLDITKRNTMFFNGRCLGSCGCCFGIHKVKPEKLRKHANKLRDKLENARNFLEKIGHKDVEIVKPSIDNYLSEERTLHQEFGNLVKKHAVKTFGCDADCIDKCVERPALITFWEVPLCLSRCECSLEGIIDVDVNKNVLWE